MAPATLRAFLCASFVVSACGSDPPQVFDPRGDASMDVVDARADVVSEDVPRDTTRPDGAYEIVHFDDTMGQLPDSIVVRGGSAYVSLAPIGRVMKVDPDGGVSLYGEIMLPTPMTGTPLLTGLAFDSEGRLYVGVAVNVTPAVGGVWRVRAGGGVGALFARNDRLVRPDGLYVDNTGELWVTDSSTGTIWRTSSDGLNVREWSTDPLLRGGSPTCGRGISGQTTGVSGIVVDRAAGQVFVTNSDKSSLVRIAIQPDGSAGAATVLTSSTDCARTRGADGFTRDTDGSFLVAATLAQTIVRVTPTGMVSAVDVPSELLQAPSGVALDTAARRVWVANSANGFVQVPGQVIRAGVVVAPLR
jgi:sugar lactone lactonase YvrE